MRHRDHFIRQLNNVCIRKQYYKNVKIKSLHNQNKICYDLHEMWFSHDFWKYQSTEITRMYTAEHNLMFVKQYHRALFLKMIHVFISLVGWNSHNKESSSWTNYLSSREQRKNIFLWRYLYICGSAVFLVSKTIKNGARYLENSV